jgi:sugar phosphate isomerase/epimerase
LTTAITDPDQNAERILATASKLGIKKIKMGYYRYTQFGKLARQMDEVRKRISAVAKLASKYGVLPCVHIHSGAFIPSHGTMLYDMLREFSPEEVGAYVDPLHMTIEGGKDGWRQGLDLLAPWIALCAMKNFDWQSGERDRKGQQRWHTRLVPVADGIAPIPEFVGALKKLGYKGHYSLHSEYKGRHSFKNMTTDECLRQTAVDLKFFRQLT